MSNVGLINQAPAMNHAPAMNQASTINQISTSVTPLPTEVWQGSP